MSRVFVAEETALGRKIVFKGLPPEMSGALSAERFRREVQLAARLHHPRIVPVVHRDWKPENVLVSGQHALVTDFGVARALSAATAEDGSLTCAGVALARPPPWRRSRRLSRAWP